MAGSSPAMVSVLTAFQPVDAEQPLFVGPDRAGIETGAAGHLAEGLDGVFVAVLGMHRLTDREIETLAAQRHALALEADQIHFDAVGAWVVRRVMRKGIGIEVRAQLAIGARQEV